MKILVTGASGRVGRKTTHALLARGHAVLGFDLSSSNIKDEHYEEHLGSITNAADVRGAMNGVDSVIHLGALMSWNPQDHTAMFQVNVEGTRLLLSAAKEAKVVRFVFASSGEVYPENAPAYLPINEKHPLCPNSFYGMTKLLGEELVKFYETSKALETVIMRFSHTQDATELLDEESFFSGPRFFFHPRIRQQEQLGNETIVNLLRKFDPGRPAHIIARNENGRAYQMHITDTRDMVDGLILALEKPQAAGEIFNLGSTDPVDFSSFVLCMAKETGYPVVNINFPGHGVYYHTSNDKIRNKLGYHPQWTIDKMLQEAAATQKKRK